MLDKYNNFSIIFDNENDSDQFFKILADHFSFNDFSFFKFICSSVISINDNFTGRFAAKIEDLLIFSTARHLATQKFNDSGLENLAHVEIGSLFGFSSILTDFASSYKLSHGAISQILIDPLDSYYGVNFDIITNLEVSKKRLEDNLTQAGVTKYKLIQKYSQDEKVIEELKQFNVASLFIDGDHTYAGILNDWNAYNEIVMVGGFVIIDNVDDNNWPSVKIFLTKLLSLINDIWKVECLLSNTIVLKKLKNENCQISDFVDLEMLNKIETSLNKKEFNNILKLKKEVKKRAVRIRNRDNEILNLKKEVKNYEDKN